jgi:hypothetical protein
MNPPKKADNDWVAIFESDFSAQYFKDKTYSDCVRYWVKRSGNNSIHEAKSTGNRYQMRNYEVYDKNFEPAVMELHDWTCVSISETFKDYFGCGLKMQISDSTGKINSVVCHTGVGYNHMKEHLLLTCIMYYLFSLSKFKSWSEVLSNNEYSSPVLTIPSFVMITIYNRYSDISRFWNPSKYKFDTEITG